MRLKGLTCMFKGSHASSTPRQTPVCPKRRPPRPQQPVFSLFRRGGLHFGHHTAVIPGLTPPNGGNCTIRRTTRRRHALGRLRVVQNPHHHRYGGRRTDRKAGLRGTRAAGHANRGAYERRHHRQPDFARNLLRSFFETLHKRCNSNDANSMCEGLIEELRAELLVESRN